MRHNNGWKISRTDNRNAVLSVSCSTIINIIVKVMVMWHAERNIQRETNLHGHRSLANCSFGQMFWNLVRK